MKAVFVQERGGKRRTEEQIKERQGGLGGGGTCDMGQVTKKQLLSLSSVTPESALSCR